MQTVDMVLDLGWGSSGKGGFAGWLALNNDYDTVTCAYGTQAGHTFNSARHNIKMMVQQLPVGIICPSVRQVLIGPGALIHADVLSSEINRYGRHLAGKRLMIHEHAAVVTDQHSEMEYASGYTKIGSTGKGVGKAAMERLERKPDANVVKNRFKGTDLEDFVVTREEYMRAMNESRNVLAEGAQGFCLSMYHGDYPYCTSRDVTPAQLVADCALPWSGIQGIRVFGVARTYPIRVNNRDGYSGPAYPDQVETSFEEIGAPPELTTVTKLERRIFKHSQRQIAHAATYCLRDRDAVVLTFGDYCKTTEELIHLMDGIKASSGCDVEYVVFGPDFSDVIDVRACQKGEFVMEAMKRIGA